MASPRSCPTDNTVIFPDFNALSRSGMELVTTSDFRQDRSIRSMAGRKYPVRAAGMHLFRPGLHQDLCSAAERAGGINHIIEQNCCLASHIADNLHGLTFVGPFPTLVPQWPNPN